MGDFQILILRFLAIKSGDEDRVRALVAKGVDPNAREEGSTTLILASMRGNTEIVKILLEAGADVETRHKKFGTRPFNTSVIHGQTETVRVLLEAGANFKIDFEILTCHKPSGIISATIRKNSTSIRPTI